MFVFGRGDLGGIESEAFDFSQLEEFMNDGNEGNIYYDALVSSSDLRVTGTSDRPNYTPRSKEAPSVSQTNHSGVVPSEPQHPKSQGYCRSSNLGSSFSKPHHLPDSPPDSGSEPPFSPPIEDPKLKCPPIEIIHYQQQQHLAEMSAGDEALKQSYLGYSSTHRKQHIPDSSSSTTSPTSSSISPPHHHQTSNKLHSPVPASPVPVHSTHSASMPILASSTNTLASQQLLTQLPQNILAPYISNTIQQQLITTPVAHMGHLYSGEEFLYDNISSPVTSTTTVGKKRKLPESPKQRNHQQNGVHVKTEPSAPSPDPSSTVLPSSEDDYSFDLNNPDPNALFVDSSYQCIRFQPFQPNTWAQLLDKDMNEVPSPQFRVDADKGFNFSNADESFVCQKKNHFQVTVHVQPVAEARFVRTADTSTAVRPIEKFALHFQGVKMESPTQTIKVEQSQSDRSKKPFHPVPLEMVVDQVSKTTVGRLHFSETTSNNMRKKGKPNPDQRFFFLVVSLCVHVPDDDQPVVIISHSSEKIIVRASNPGQFENDMELSWQKGHTIDSIFHNGRVGINTDRPEEALVVHGNIKVTGHILQPSDLRAKYDIHELDTRKQLQNVSNLRIVQYRYLPGLADRLGASSDGKPTTGVIAQEIRDIIPEAVVEAGDLVLENGRLIEKLLVVNKERIFMENVGAVKELCKVTDNLETRIDELERINKKLSSIKRKDSLKSTSTDLSRISSFHGKQQRRCRSHVCGKRRPGHPSHSCSSHFIQSTIVILVVIMACCLLALATLYLMEYQTRNDRIFRGPFVVTVGSPSYRNTTVPMHDKFSIFTTLFPTVSWSRTPTENVTKISTSNISPAQPTAQTGVTNTEDPLSIDTECLSVDTDDCPVYCCDPFFDEDDLIPISQEEEGGLRQQHVDKKRSENISILDDIKSSNVESHTVEKVPETEQSQDKNNKSSSTHKVIKRLTSSEETLENNIGYAADDSLNGPMLHLLELNMTLLPELCHKERPEGFTSEQITCIVQISRHFSHPNVTLIIRNEESDTVIRHCSSNHYTSCSGRIADPKGHAGISKRETLPEDHVWQLPVGSYFRSRYRFRMMPQIFSTNQNICSLDNNSPFSEYIITFQRRCDK